MNVYSIYEALLPKDYIDETKIRQELNQRKRPW